MEPARLLRPWDFPGKDTGVGCHFLLQEVFLTSGSNPRLLHWQADSLPLSHLGSVLDYGSLIKEAGCKCVLWVGMDYDMHIRVVLTGKLFAVFKN